MALRQHNFFFFLIYLATLGLHRCVGFPLVAESRGYFLVMMHRLLTVGAFLVAELRLNCSEARGAFPAEGSNLCLLHCQADSLPLSHWGSPNGSTF